MSSNEFTLAGMYSMDWGIVHTLSGTSFGKTCFLSYTDLITWKTAGSMSTVRTMEVKANRLRSGNSVSTAPGVMMLPPAEVDTTVTTLEKRAVNAVSR